MKTKKIKKAGNLVLKEGDTVLLFKCIYFMDI